MVLKQKQNSEESVQDFNKGEAIILTCHLIEFLCDELAGSSHYGDELEQLFGAKEKREGAGLTSKRNKDLVVCWEGEEGWKKESDIRMTLEGINFTQISEFLLLGFSEDPKQQQLLFILFLSMYLVTGLGNILIILAIVTDT
ncbi:Olfactory receptor 7A5 [Galemys pyrenaicus]|uniref:Olfactory receptor 7A5 n=1 Tax=Galemys pyrenaicus TaxID=202257 RepID=A0A8J6DQR0_GALPY|nr:Olfactory receptor 7A5 [Galemys pyrenaicus]